jgi:MFS transporter, DHA1 family, tetracycline resistance protein
MRIGLSCMFIGLFGIAFAKSLWALAIIQTFLAVGNGLTNPSILGSISLSVNPDEQGVALGTAQSMSALGRIIGPALGGLLFSTLGRSTPFIAAGLCTLVGIIIILVIFNTLPNSAKVQS